MKTRDGDFTEKTIITDFIPPIAQVWEETLLLSQNDFANRFNHLLESYEALLKSLVAILYGRLRYLHEAHQLDEFIKNRFARPALGTFQESITLTLKILSAKEDAWGTQLAQDFREQLSNPAASYICRFARKELQSQEWNKKKVSVHEVFKILIELRNRTRGHGVIREGIVNEEVTLALHETLFELFKTLQQELQAEWFVVHSVRNVSDREQEYEMHRMQGIHKEPFRATLRDLHLLDGKVYAHDPDLTPPWIELWPIAHWENKKIYLYNAFSANTVEFVNYREGERTHLKGLQFESLFSLPAATALTDEKIDLASSAEKSESGGKHQPEAFSPATDFSDNSAGAMLLKGRITAGSEAEPLVFMSYACIDNQPLSGETKGWVTTLGHKLKRQLGLKLGCELQLEELGMSELQEAAACIDTIPETALLLVVLSSNYLDSAWGQGEFFRFMKERVRNSSVLIVERDNFSDALLPEELNDVTDLRYGFYVVDRADESPHVLMPDIQQDMHRYNNLLARLNRELADKLQKIRRQQQLIPRSVKTGASTSSNGRPTIFLAGVTDDLEDEREELKSFLTTSNISVIPEFCYFNEPESFEECIRNDLTKSELFVQLLGPRPGKKAPGLPRGYVYRQYELAKKAGLTIRQWRSPGLDLQDVRNADWARFLEMEGISATDFDEFKAKIAKHFAPSEEKDSTQKSSKGKRPMVFIDAYNDDLEITNSICQMFEKQGVGYFLPLQSDKPAENREAFEQYVLNCDATLIVYGDVTPKWVSDQVLAVHKISWQREQGFASAILDGPSQRKPPEQKAPVNFKLPGMEVLQCRRQLDEQQLGNFISSIHMQ